MYHHSWATIGAVLVLLQCLPAHGRLLTSTAVANGWGEQSPSAAVHEALEQHGLGAIPFTAAHWGAILGTSIGAFILGGLWAMRCCLRHASPDHDHLFIDSQRPNSPLLTPRTPQSPRSNDGRRSWSSSPATYTPPPVKLLASPKADLSHGVGGGSSVLVFTKEQLSNARDSLCNNVDGFVTTSLRSKFAGVASSWLLEGLNGASISSQASDSRREHFELSWARQRLWQWLDDNMWGGADNPLVARGKVRDQASKATGSDGVTKTQAARELLSAIKKNPNHNAFRTAITTFSQQLLADMSEPAQAVDPSAEPAAAAAAVHGVVESALLFQLQMLGTSAGMQVYVPGRPSDADVPAGAVVFDHSQAQLANNAPMLCIKPGVIELKSLGGTLQSVVVLPAHAVSVNA